MTGRRLYSTNYESSHKPKYIIYIFAEASQKLAAGRIWPAGRTLDMPALQAGFLVNILKKYLTNQCEIKGLFIWSG